MILTFPKKSLSLDGGDMFARAGDFTSIFAVGCALCAVCFAGVTVSVVSDLVFVASFGRSFCCPKRVDCFAA